MLTGIHHITAIASDPIKNLRFYIDVLGQRMIKKTVNFDDPETYHTYFGDYAGTPGTLITFFPHPRARPSRHGAGEVSRTIYSAPVGSIGYWIDRLKKFGIEASIDEANARVDFSDHDDMRLAIVEAGDALKTSMWSEASVDPKHALNGFDGIEIDVASIEPTTQFLTDVMGFKHHKVLTGPHFFTLDEGHGHQRLWIRETPGVQMARPGAGAVHHVAWRVPDDSAHVAIREKIERSGANPTPVVERDYFRSIYFREPGGTIFEIATDGPGFAIDESVEQFAHSLKMPVRYEPHRKEIEAGLIPITNEMLKPQR